MLNAVNTSVFMPQEESQVTNQSISQEGTFSVDLSDHNYNVAQQYKYETARNEHRLIRNRFVTLALAAHADPLAKGVAKVYEAIELNEDMRK